MRIVKDRLLGIAFAGRQAYLILGLLEVRLRKGERRLLRLQRNSERFRINGEQNRTRVDSLVVVDWESEDGAADLRRHENDIRRHVGIAAEDEHLRDEFESDVEQKQGYADTDHDVPFEPRERPDLAKANARLKRTMLH